MRVAANGPRRSVNLTLPVALIERARRVGLNLSGVAETAIAAEVARLARERFADEIRQGVEQHHRWLDEYGSFADEVRAAQFPGDADAG
jgi:post-segregation antitoxin (ccd killing protein)